MNKVKEIARYTGVFIGTAVLLAGLLLLSVLIPQSALKQHMRQSADQLTKINEHFIDILPDMDCTQLDQYADSMLLNVAYHMDSEHPLTSVIWCRIHNDEDNTRNMDLYESVYNDAEANEQYLRYWHGSVIFVRLFHLIGSIRQMYWLHAAVLLALLVVLEAMLFRRGMKTEAICVGIAMVAVNLWVVPFCLEYYWMFALALAVSIIIVSTDKSDGLGLFFMVVGIVTAFLDFLTTETLTLTLPLILAVRMRQKAGRQADIKFIVSNALLWLVGYVGMWASKWVISACVLRENVLPYLVDLMEYHLGMKSRYSYFALLYTGLIRNMMCLFPQGYGIWGITLALSMLLFVVILVVTDRIALKKCIDKRVIGIYALIGMVPYARYVAIVRHMWWHYFFTYRAQAATVFALCFIIEELLEKNPEKEVKNRAQSKQTHITYRPHALPERRSKHRILH